jgi:hypothetical protein
VSNNARANNFVIDKVAQENGLSSTMMRTISSIETGGRYNANAKNPKSSAYGLFQQIDQNWSTYGKGLNRNKPADQAEAAAREIKVMIPQLTKFLGRPPQPWEVYLAHQQGVGGFEAMYKAYKANPNASTASVVGAAAAGLNAMGGKTVGQSMDLWRKKYAVYEAGTLNLATMGFHNANSVDPNAKGTILATTYGQEGATGRSVAAAPIANPTGVASVTTQGAAVASSVPVQASTGPSQYDIQRTLNSPAYGMMMQQRGSSTIQRNPGDNTPKPGLGLPTVIEDGGLMLFNSSVFTG